jgi:rubrerythrin
MSKELKGSETEKNLEIAFAGESKARTKYTFYASKARKEGFQQIAAIFDETAGNEKEHAELWFKALHGGEIHTTVENLLDAAQGEEYEADSMYKDMAEVARKEGFLELAFAFEGVGKIEKRHENRYRALLKNVQENQVFAKTEVVVWKCRNCGHIHVGTEAPKICPVCKHEQAYFELNCDNY